MAVHHPWIPVKSQVEFYLNLTQVTHSRHSRTMSSEADVLVATILFLPGL